MIKQKLFVSVLFCKVSPCLFLILIYSCGDKPAPKPQLSEKKFEPQQNTGDRNSEILTQAPNQGSNKPLVEQILPMSRDCYYGSAGNNFPTIREASSGVEVVLRPYSIAGF